MKILITGGAGYVGSKLVPVLLDRGYEVDVADILMFRQFLPGNVKLIKSDIFDLTQKDLIGYDQVIFLAGVSNDPMAEFSPSHNFISNAAGPSYLAYISKLAGIKRFIFASSCSVYGYTEDKVYDEVAKTDVSFPYGISKLQGEQGVLHFIDDNFSVIVLRKGTICGYSPRMRYDLVINTMFRDAIKNGIITVNNASLWRPILSIDDAVKAYVRSIEASPSISGVFNIMSENYTLGSLADEIRTCIQTNMQISVKINVKNIADLRNYKVSCLKARNVLNFIPSDNAYSITMSLIDNRHLCSDFDNPEYYNIEIFKKWINKK